MGHLQPTSNHQPDAARPCEATLGFGCASLYGLPSKRDRRAVLEAAYECGFRHFDVAPIYGLGLAEAELTHFIGDRPDIKIATKFGITPSCIGRIAGLVQSPVRRVLHLSPALRATVRGSGSGANRHIANRVLYSGRNYSLGHAREALHASLRTLKVDRIEYFLLHEPARAALDVNNGLAEYLEQQRVDGVVGHWGPAGDLSRMDARLTKLVASSSVLQIPYDLIGGHRGPRPDRARPTISFGIMSTTLPHIRGMLTRRPDFRRRCNDLLDADLSEQRTLTALLVRDAVRNNPFGTVLVSTTKIPRLKSLRDAAGTPLRHEAEVASMIRREWASAAAP